MKKLLIGLGTAASVAAPVAAVVSCTPLQSSILENNKEDVSQDTTNKYEPETETTTKTESETKTETLTDNTDSVNDKTEDKIVPTYFDNIEDIIQAVKTTKAHGKSSQFIEYVTDDQIKDLIINSLDKKLPDEVKIQIYDRNNINYSGIISFKVLIQWNNSVSQEIPVSISGFAALNVRGGHTQETRRTNAKLNKAYLALYNRGRYNGREHFPLRAKDVSDILPSEYAKTYNQLSSEDKKEAFEKLFHRYNNYKEFWVIIIEKALGQEYKNELDGIRVTAEIGEAQDSKGKLIFRLFLHDDKAKQSIRSIGFYVSQFKKSGLKNDDSEDFQRTVYVGEIYITGSKK